MQEEIKNSINDESKEKRKLNDADLAQVTGGGRSWKPVVNTDILPWDICDHNCSACNLSNCPQRNVE